MPLYEYQCPGCGRFERIQKFADPPLTECPTCGKPVSKLISAPAIQFKGSGWYITDYARKSAGSGDGPSQSGDAAVSKESASKEASGAKAGGAAKHASATKASGSRSAK